MRDDDSPVCSKSMLSLPMTPNENRSRLAVQQKIQNARRNETELLLSLLVFFFIILWKHVVVRRTSCVSFFSFSNHFKKNCFFSLLSFSFFSLVNSCLHKKRSWRWRWIFWHRLRFELAACSLSYKTNQFEGRAWAFKPLVQPPLQWLLSLQP